MPEKNRKRKSRKDREYTRILPEEIVALLREKGPLTSRQINHEFRCREIRKAFGDIGPLNPYNEGELGKMVEVLKVAALVQTEVGMLTLIARDQIEGYWENKQSLFSVNEEIAGNVFPQTPPSPQPTAS